MTNRIRELRESQKMTQIRLSIELEVTQETVSAYETGKHYPSFASLVKMSELFHASIDYIMRRSDVRLPGAAHLDSEEAELLSSYRRLSPFQRGKVQGYLTALLE